MHFMFFYYLLYTVDFARVRGKILIRQIAKNVKLQKIQSIV